MASSIAGWRSHHVLHKLGAVGVLLATLIFLVGFSVPTWTTQYGLWMVCSSSQCVSNLHNHPDVWITTVRVMECIALLIYILCCVMMVLQDCCLVTLHSPCNRTVEIMAGAAGIASLSGAIVFGICWSNNKTVFPSPGFDSLQEVGHTSKLYWGFALVITASVIILLSAIAIAFTRHRHTQSMFPSKNMSDSTTEGRNLFDESVTFKHYPDPDTTSMMLVPASHFDTSRTINREASDPPPYALPPPYPYRSPCDVFLPIAFSSPVMPQTRGTPSVSRQSQVTTGADQSLSVVSADRTVATPFSASAFCIQSKRPVMQPLFIKTSDGGSQIEITPSAQNSSGLPSPFNHF